MSKNGKFYYNNKSSLVDSSNNFYEIESTYPPITKSQSIIYVQNFTLNNDGVTTSMKVNGLVTPQKFIVQPNSEYDVYISSLTFLISAQATVDLEEFGGGIISPGGRLTNGCKLYIESIENGEFVIAENIRTNFDLVNIGLFKPSFGIGSASFRVNTVISTLDSGYFSVVKFSDYGYDREYAGGLLLRKNSTDRIIFEIRDNLNRSNSEIQSFDAIAYGFKRIN